MLAALGAIFSRYGASVDVGRAVRRVSADGTIVPGPVTPDMMAQGRGLSVVVEIKAGFPSCARARQKIFEQLKKYDCRLVGWMEKDVDRHDIVAATLPQNAVEMSNYLNSKAGSDGGPFSNPLCVAEFARLRRDEESFFVKAVSGCLTNPGLCSSMRRGIEISTLSALLNFSALWFYDSEPHPTYTMSILWEKIFSEAVKGRILQEGAQLCITVDEIMEGFRALGSFAPSIPRRRWIVKAMDGLVKIKMARKGADGAYIVDYASIKGEDLLEVFARKWAAAHGGDAPGHA